MPDDNKFDKLREIGYTIPMGCALCVHAHFPAYVEWGTCGKHLYQHLKHTGEPREVSIHRAGTCPDAYCGAEPAAGVYGAHAEFLAFVKKAL
jgi:hypothetical protein